MRAILIDTKAARAGVTHARMDDVIKVVDIENLNDVRTLLGAELLELVQTNSPSINMAHAVWVDEEALVKPKPAREGLSMRKGPTMFGNVVITGMENGDITPASVPLGFIQTMFITGSWCIFAKP